MSIYYNQIEYDKKRNLKRIKDAAGLIDKVDLKYLTVYQSQILSKIIGQLIKLVNLINNEHKNKVQRS
jgi:hypothetical protein